jgi:hypothetical protein
MPRSVIFSAGITGSARKASCRNGSSSVTPSETAAHAQLRAGAHLLEGRQAHQPGHRQRQFGQHLAVAHHDETALDLASRLAATAMSA